MHCLKLRGDSWCMCMFQGAGPFRVLHRGCPRLQTLWLWTPTARRPKPWGKLAMGESRVTCGIRSAIRKLRIRSLKALRRSRYVKMWRIVEVRLSGAIARGNLNFDWIWPFSTNDLNDWISNESSSAPCSTFCSAGFLDILQQESAGILLYIWGASVLARIAWADWYVSGCARRCRCDSVRTSVSISPTLTFKIEQTRKLHRTPPEPKKQEHGFLQKWLGSWLSSIGSIGKVLRADPEALLTGMTP